MKCYLSLSGIPASKRPASAIKSPALSLGSEASFLVSRWWTCGWTLQEPFAPFGDHCYKVEWGLFTINEGCAAPSKRLWHSGGHTHLPFIVRSCIGLSIDQSHVRDMASCLLSLFYVQHALYKACNFGEEIVGSHLRTHRVSLGLCTPKK